MVFYIPAIAFTAFYGLLAMSDVVVVLPVVLVGLALFFASGVLLSRGIIWGAVVGILPAVSLIYMGTQATGQIINEMPIGILVLIFYLTCGGVVFYRGKK
ncbi:MAG: hypothetical protein RR197_00460 [Oscillospiraceae bacterium]